MHLRMHRNWGERSGTRTEVSTRRYFDQCQHWTPNFSESRGALRFAGSLTALGGLATWRFKFREPNCELRDAHCAPRPLTKREAGHGVRFGLRRRGGRRGGGRWRFWRLEFRRLVADVDGAGRVVRRVRAVGDRVEGRAVDRGFSPLPVAARGRRWSDH